MTLSYLVRRLGMFVLVIWLASTVNFFLPRLGSGDPVRQQLIQQAALGGSVQAGMDDMVAEYNEKFGLNTPLWQQYLNYMWDMLHFDFNYSIANYPAEVLDIIAESLPWTLGLLFTTTILAWLIGGFLGAFLGWPRAPKSLQILMPPLLALNAIPFFLLGLVLIYVFAFQLRWFPLSGGYSIGAFPEWSWSFAWDVFRHSVLPAMAIILVSIGGWALTMRSMMITTTGEDYITYADAKGLKNRTIFVHYSIRNVLLPQTTALALVLGQLIAGTVLVEVIFSYPGIGTTLFNAIQGSDFFLVQGIVFFLILSIAVSTLVLDLIYPLLDPRITYQKA
ncbi:MAG TPA: ABC transporter permease [Thermomicrobiales bacterium]|nr:ABC transporter permease [Thermomicrobiales bacterium]